jgi:hypothetical protein
MSDHTPQKSPFVFDLLVFFFGCVHIMVQSLFNMDRLRTAGAKPTMEEGVVFSPLSRHHQGLQRSSRVSSVLKIEKINWVL